WRYAAVRTPKGRRVSDLRVVRGPRPSDESLLLELPSAALPGLLAHLARFLPPRLARATDASGELGRLTVAGPEAARWLARDALGLRAEASALEGLAEGDWLRPDAGGPGV